MQFPDTCAARDRTELWDAERHNKLAGIHKVSRKKTPTEPNIVLKNCRELGHFEKSSSNVKNLAEETAHLKRQLH